MKIVFVGDVFLGGDLTAKELKSCIDVKRFHHADYKIINLEHPISDAHNIADKSVLFTGSEVLETLKRSGINAVCLANNHIHDKLDIGILETIENLRKHRISFFGAGRNLHEAKKPLWVDNNLCLLGYCQFNSPTLNNIQLATENSPGVAPLTLEGIESDLDKIPNDSKAILYLHWGREHVWFTQYKNIELAKKLLKNDKVALIVGTHPHRVQGFLSVNNKRAYFSLGNCLFPNFLIKPSIEVVNQALDIALTKKVDVTRQYHSVSKLTYKKWRFVNRVSQLVEYDTESKTIDHIFLYQQDDFPVVKELTGIPRFLFVIIVNYLNVLYRFPKLIYRPMEKLFSSIRFKIWRVQVILFKMRQMGFVHSIKKRFQK
ncbi:CapA family protein [Pseudozobellia thermophila]|uniref:Poly-gamma-glutamate synthesis protein (Capsule biosynthesis protein) n=1 Tax=Pseudozobellia thermophila TaxID=192903 RepID=A0A1M6BM63_9FLAO|nr:CapA family protein [Pseudozobellia thermophila]SHI49794.1 poly-gamma-glutamate synthesis protein (capsule biosynthesis protein) [Pseudozobellia thermophila]